MKIPPLTSGSISTGMRRLIFLAIASTSCVSLRFTSLTGRAGAAGVAAVGAGGAVGTGAEAVEAGGAVGAVGAGGGGGGLAVGGTRALDVAAGLLLFCSPLPLDEDGPSSLVGLVGFFCCPEVLEEGAAITGL